MKHINQKGLIINVLQIADKKGIDMGIVMNNVVIKKGLKMTKLVKNCCLMTVLLIFACSYSHALEIDLDVIKQIESSGNPFAYNSRSKARGLYQITPICLADFNKYSKVQFTEQELFDPDVNKIVASWYLQERIPQLLRYYRQDITLNNILISYNCGMSCVVKGRMPKETGDYINKYKRGLK